LQIFSNKSLNLWGFYQSLSWQSAICLLLLSALGALSGCSTSSSLVQAPQFDPKKLPAPGYLIALDAFSQSKSPSAAKPVDAADTLVPRAVSDEVSFKPLVLLYDSATTRAYMNAGSIDGTHRVVVWETFLKKYKFPYVKIDRAEQIDARRASVLILPSSLALAQAERQAVLNFRASGGSVLSTWAAGVRDEKGTWKGFGFMEQVLDTKVVGTTASDTKDNFLMIGGDSPINQSLEAGQRVWTESIKEWPALRIEAKNPAVHIMDWSRTFDDKKSSANSQFNERAFERGKASRVVTLGYPERLYSTANPQQLEAILHNSLTWLMRFPTANLSAWPQGKTSAVLFALDCAEILLDADLLNIKALEKAGVSLTLYFLGDNAKRSSDKLKQVLQAGHELALKGDKFVGFKGQSETVQAQRFDSALLKFKEAGLEFPAAASFHAPTEAYDAVTQALVAKLGLGSFIAFQDVSETRLPKIAGAEPISSGKAPLVLFPRSQRGPEDATEEGDVEDGLKSFYAELALSLKMRGLAVIRMPNQGLLSLDDIQQIADNFAQHKSHTWFATASQISQWWLERQRISVRLDGSVGSPSLRVMVAGQSSVKAGAVVLVNVPRANQTIELRREGQMDTGLKVTRLDQYQVAVQLPALALGEHVWNLTFKNEDVQSTK
jgi:hypothetical protein